MEPGIDTIICPSPEEIAARRERLWTTLQKDVSTCRRCPLAETRTRTVFGEGPLSASLMFVGEGPGADEDEQGLPFVGKAGQLLTTILSAAGIIADAIDAVFEDTSVSEIFGGQNQH